MAQTFRTQRRNKILYDRFLALHKEGWRTNVIYDKLAAEFYISKKTVYRCLKQGKEM